MVDEEEEEKYIEPLSLIAFCRKQLSFFAGAVFCRVRPLPPPPIPRRRQLAACNVTIHPASVSSSDVNRRICPSINDSCFCHTSVL